MSTTPTSIRKREPTAPRTRAHAACRSFGKAAFASRQRDNPFHFRAAVGRSTTGNQHRNRVKSGLTYAWKLLTEVADLGEYRTLREAVRHGQRPSAELVDAYNIQSPRVRAQLIRYLDERRASLDLPDHIAEAWRQRVKTVTMPDDTTRPRKDYKAVLVCIRGVYRDLQEWALEDPSWAEWVAFLAAIRQVSIGDTIEHNGREYRRTAPRTYGLPHRRKTSHPTRSRTWPPGRSSMSAGPSTTRSGLGRSSRCCTNRRPRRGTAGDHPLGHKNINTTRAYMAVFDEQLVRSYRTFLDNRRATRPEAEYREPTDEEWREFQQHFKPANSNSANAAGPTARPASTSTPA